MLANGMEESCRGDLCRIARSRDRRNERVSRKKADLGFDGSRDRSAPLQRWQKEMFSDGRDVRCGERGGHNRQYADQPRKTANCKHRCSALHGGKSDIWKPAQFACCEIACSLVKSWSV